MKMLTGIIAAAGLVMMTTFAEAAVTPRWALCYPVSDHICGVDIVDLHPGEVQHITVDLPTTGCFPVVVAHRVSAGSTWESEAPVGVGATVSGLSGPTDPRVSFIVRNDSDVPVGGFLGFKWGCLE